MNRFMEQVDLVEEKKLHDYDIYVAIATQAIKRELPHSWDERNGYVYIENVSLNEAISIEQDLRHILKADFALTYNHKLHQIEVAYKS